MFSMRLPLCLLIDFPVSHVRIYNSLTRQIEAFVPIEAGVARMYVCGMTIYDFCHVGHARMMMAFDVVARWLRASGFQVIYVRNITDIDDKIIRRAVERGVTIRALTDEMIAAMHSDIGALGIEKPTFEPRATEYVDHMLGMIESLERKGLAYRSKSGDVNYSVRRFSEYGKLSGRSLDELRSGERVAVEDSKEDPLDFVLWKSSKADEPDDVKYPSAFGTGRPGWHIECSAMSCALLGPHFDIHGGGLDLQFPHHENEIAQSEGASGEKFVNYWMHNGFLNVDNEKMSKSLGNFFTIREVLNEFDGETLRFFMLRTHYRSPFNFSHANLVDAKAALRRLYTVLQKFWRPELLQRSDIDWTHRLASKFQNEMNEDFNTPGAVSVLFELASDLNRGESASDALLLRQLGGVLGILQQDPSAFLQSGRGLDPDVIRERIEARHAAKAARDFRLADQIRSELLAQGVQLMDSPQGTTWVRS